MSDEDNIVMTYREFTKSEIKTIGELFQNTVKTHNECEGNGAVMSDDETGAVSCDCTYSFNYLRDLIYARIPRKFWELELVKDFSKYLDGNLSLLTSGGSIHGMPGIGKTRFLSFLGKFFIKEKKRVTYFSMFDIESIVKNEESEDSVILMERLMNSNVLLLDEIENFEFGKDFWVSKKVKRILNKFSDSGNSIYFTTSFPNISEISEINSGLGRLCEKIANDNNVIVIKYKIEFSPNQNYLKKSFVKEAKSCQ